MAMLKKREDLTDTKDNNAMFALGLSDSFGDFFVVSNNRDEKEDIDKEIAKINKMDLNMETKSNIINEYNMLKGAKSLKEKNKYQKNIDKMLKKENLK